MSAEPKFKSVDHEVEWLRAEILRLRRLDKCPSPEDSDPNVRRLAAIVHAWYEQTPDAEEQNDNGPSLARFMAKYGITVPDGVVQESAEFEPTKEQFAKFFGTSPREGDR